jgi:phospho-N-acetylmuramoyl-pentapeptide-transferase
MGSQASGLRAHEKFLLESFLALGASAWLYWVLKQQTVWLPFLGDYSVGIFYIPLVAFLLVFFASAFGLTDGLDGLSAGTHALSFLAYGVIAYQLGLLPLSYFCAILAGAELAFLYFNIYPARIEMSDVGTVPLGLAFVLVGVLTNRLWLLPVIGLIFVLEIGSSFFQVLFLKWWRKKLLLMAPFHHHFEMRGWPETKVTMRLWLFVTVTSLLGIFLSFF